MKKPKDCSHFEFFKSLARKHAIQGNPFLGEEDLLQEIFLTWIQIQRDYGENPNFEKILRKAAKLHVLTLIRDLHDISKRDAAGAKAELFTDPNWDILDLEKLNLLKKDLSPLSVKVVEEYLSPSKKTLRLAEERRLRQVHLHKIGKRRRKYETVELSREVIRESLGIPRTRLYSCIREIKTKMEELKWKWK